MRQELSITSTVTAYLPLDSDARNTTAAHDLTQARTCGIFQLSGDTIQLYGHDIDYAPIRHDGTAVYPA